MKLWFLLTSLGISCDYCFLCQSAVRIRLAVFKCCSMVKRRSHPTLVSHVFQYKTKPFVEMVFEKVTSSLHLWICEPQNKKNKNLKTNVCVYMEVGKFLHGNIRILWKRGVPTRLRGRALEILRTEKVSSVMKWFFEYSVNIENVWNEKKNDA